MIANCPVCDVKITIPSAKECAQCGSNLEVFEMVDKIEERAIVPSAENAQMLSKKTDVEHRSTESSLREKPSKILLPILFGMGVLTLIGGFVLVYQFQISLFDELRQERIHRQHSEARKDKITETLIEKNSAAYEATMHSLNTLNEMTKEQQNSIEKLNVKIDEIEKKGSFARKPRSHRALR